MLALLQMVVALQKLLRTQCSPLEGSVGYTVPDNSVLAALLTQLEGLQGLWAQVDRSALTPVMVQNMFTSLPHYFLFYFASSIVHRKCALR